MQLKQLFTDEKAVSPVIGVILMVAITVILAAVIASFVLGLGGTSDPAPNPVFDWSQDNDTVIIDVTGGDSFDCESVELSGTHNNVTETWCDVDVNGDSTVSAGSTAEIDVTDNIDDWEIDLIWSTPDADPEIIASNDA